MWNITDLFYTFLRLLIQIWLMPRYLLLLIIELTFKLLLFSTFLPQLKRYLGIRSQRYISSLYNSTRAERQEESVNSPRPHNLASLLVLDYFP